jgi:hypothetical protein
MSTGEFPQDKFPPPDFASRLEDPLRMGAYKNNPSSIEKRGTNHSKAAAEDTGRALVIDGEPTGVLPLNEDRDLQRKIFTSAGKAAPKTPEQQRNAARLTVQRALDVVTDPLQKITTDAHLRTLSLCLDILAQLDKAEPQETEDEYKARLRQTLTSK